jgi:hypothetical protein
VNRPTDRLQRIFKCRSPIRAESPSGGCARVLRDTLLFGYRASFAALLIAIGFAAQRTGQDLAFSRDCYIDVPLSRE